MRSDSWRRAVVLILSSVIYLGTTACGGDEMKKSEGPIDPDASATSTPKTNELSQFEQDPAVQTVRAAMKALARDVNDKAAAMPHLKEVTSAKMFAALSGQMNAPDGDLTLGYTYPGPQPFKPIDVVTEGNRTTITACMLMSGWVRDPKTKKAVAPREVGAATFGVIKQGNARKWDTFLSSKADCGGVDIVEEKS